MRGFSFARPDWWRKLARRRLPALAAVLAAGLAPCGYAQVRQLTATDQCYNQVAERIGPEQYSGASVPLHELAARSAAAAAICEQAVAEQPANARLYGRLAQARALAGDGKGALEAARKGAGLRSPAAQVLLGVMLADGVLLPRDYAAARELFMAAAKEGHPLANFNLGVMWANGWGSAADRGDAFKYFNLAARGGDAVAMQIRGVMESGGRAAAEDWWKKAAETMDPEGPRNPLRVAALGVAAPDGAALLRWYGQQAEGGAAWAQAYLGALHEAGQWVAQDYARAAQWYQRAGEAGNTAAQWRLARLYRIGLGVPQDEQEARRWGQMYRVQACVAQANAEPALGECDRLAADRHDPDRVAQGMADPFCLQHFAERAVAACTGALAQTPGVVRLRAQRARALAFMGRFEEARKDAATAAAKGSSASMVLLGVMSQRGLGVPKDEARALDWYRKAADLGNQRAAHLVLRSTDTGVGVERGSPAAQALAAQMRERFFSVTAAPVDTLQAQAERGDASAEHNLAARFEQAKDYAQAIKWYERAAAHGSEMSAMNLAQMYEKGIGVKADPAEAIRRYKVLAGQGNGEARYRLAVLAESSGDYAQAADLHQRSIDRGDFRAMLNLGEMHEQGRGVKQDVKRAVALYERAADRSPWARARLGVLYLEHAEVRDYAKARLWLEKSAADNNPVALLKLGTMHEEGLGMRRDHAAAAQFYFDALKGGAWQARDKLDSLYERDLGKPADDAQAVAWWRRGAEAGVPAARYRLGMAYAAGRGVARNDAEALKWLDLAASDGHPKAREEAGNRHYARGEYQVAAQLGNPRALERILDQARAQGASRAQTDEIRAMLTNSRPQPTPMPPQAIRASAVGDPQRSIQVRAAGSGQAASASMDASIADIYSIIPWFATDAKAAAK